ncbi:MAG: hypothetical protein KIT16_15745, partial [Rhodospirillaceae bacterium]|nr:hypothetical protein [Rhodospirillaceae bacterium]
MAAAAFVCCYGAIVGGVRVLYDAPAGDVPQTYGTLLLREIPPPRLIVDGGSNGATSILGAELERRFGRNVVIASDNASIVYKARLKRLEAYARRGDVVVMALEWQYYTRRWVNWPLFAENAFGRYNDYFTALDWRRQLELAVFEAGLRGVWAGMRKDG